jgi:hypothetical protein
LTGIVVATVKNQASWPQPDRPQSQLQRPRLERFCYSRTRLLVIGGADFYNPRNTLTAAVVSFTGVHSTRPGSKMDLLSAGECLKIDLHFDIPRSTE